MQLNQVYEKHIVKKFSKKYLFEELKSDEYKLLFAPIQKVFFCMQLVKYYK